eukprot:3082862-Pyramimonas_sp.AAC.1
MPATQWPAMFYRLLAALTERYEAVEQPDGLWHGWGTVMLCSTPSHDLLEVYLCRGHHVEQLTRHPMARGYYFVGYMSISVMLMFYWDVLLRGHYVEVVAYSEDMVAGDVIGDLYVRVPAVNAQ